MSKTFHFEGDLIEVLDQLEEVEVALGLVLELLRGIVDGDPDQPLQAAFTDPADTSDARARPGSQ